MTKNAVQYFEAVVNLDYTRENNENEHLTEDNINITESTNDKVERKIGRIKNNKIPDENYVASELIKYWGREVAADTYDVTKEFQ